MITMMDGCADSTEDNDDDNDGVEDVTTVALKEKSDGNQRPYTDWDLRRL